MNILLTAVIMVAFSAVYAAVLGMLGGRMADLMAALLGRPVRVQAAGGAPLVVSRRFSRA